MIPANFLPHSNLNFKKSELIAFLLTKLLGLGGFCNVSIKLPRLIRNIEAAVFENFTVDNKTDQNHVICENIVLSLTISVMYIGMGPRIQCA